eukprot:1325577-Prymnesium_polylepis.1
MEQRRTHSTDTHPTGEQAAIHYMCCYIAPSKSAPVAESAPLTYPYVLVTWQTWPSDVNL